MHALISILTMGSLLVLYGFGPVGTGMNWGIVIPGAVSFILGTPWSLVIVALGAGAEASRGLLLLAPLPNLALHAISYRRDRRRWKVQ